MQVDMEVVYVEEFSGCFKCIFSILELLILQFVVIDILLLIVELRKVNVFYFLVKGKGFVLRRKEYVGKRYFDVFSCLEIFVLEDYM